MKQYVIIAQLSLLTIMIGFSARVAFRTLHEVMDNKVDSGPCVKWDYDWHQFSREDKDWAKVMVQYREKGWAYAGPMANNGINAKYVLFKKCLKRLP